MNLKWWIYFDVLSFSLFSFLFLSHFSLSNLMMSLSTREARTRGMIFSFLFSCGLAANNLKYSYKRGVHYKSVHLVLDDCVYLDSFSMDRSTRIGAFPCLLKWSLYAIVMFDTRPIKWTYRSLWVCMMHICPRLRMQRSLWTQYLLIT